MGKVYKTNEKYLHTIHRPTFPIKSNDIDIPTSTSSHSTVCDLSTSLWNPIRKQFFHDDDDDDEDDSNPENNIEAIPNHGIQQRQHQGLDLSQSSLELQWDESPEQYQLDEDAYESDLNEVLKPRVLFPPVNEDDQVKVRMGMVKL